MQLVMMASDTLTTQITHFQDADDIQSYPDPFQRHCKQRKGVRLPCHQAQYQPLSRASRDVVCYQLVNTLNFSIN